MKEDLIDFGIVSSPLEEEELTVIPVMEIQDTFVAGRRFLPYKNKMLDFSILEELPLICLEGKTSTRAYLETFLEKQDIFVKPEFELATSDMIVQFALRNLGIGCVVRDFAKQQIDEGKLFELRFTQVLPSRHICVVKSQKNGLSAAAKELLMMIEGDFVLR